MLTHRGSDAAKRVREATGRDASRGFTTTATTEGLVRLIHILALGLATAACSCSRDAAPPDSGSDTGGSRGETLRPGDDSSPTSGGLDETSGTDGGDDGNRDEPGTGRELACQTDAGRPCPEGEFCYLDPGACILPYSAWGECLPIPGGCDPEFDPVCGCDEITYVNACAAHEAGTNVAFPGRCGEMSASTP